MSVMTGAAPPPPPPSPETEIRNLRATLSKTEKLLLSLPRPIGTDSFPWHDVTAYERAPVAADFESIRDRLWKLRATSVARLAELTRSLGTQAPRSSAAGPAPLLTTSSDAAGATGSLSALAVSFSSASPISPTGGRDVPVRIGSSSPSGSAGPPSAERTTLLPFSQRLQLASTPFTAAGSVSPPVPTATVSLVSPPVSAPMPQPLAQPSQQQQQQQPQRTPVRVSEARASSPSGIRPGDAAPLPLTPRSLAFAPATVAAAEATSLGPEGRVLLQRLDQLAQEKIQVAAARDRERAELQQQYAQARAIAERLSAENATLRQKLQAATGRVTDLENLLKELQSAGNDIERKMDTARVEVQRLRTELTTTMKELQSTRDALADKERELATVTRERERLDKELMETKSRHTRTLRELKQRVDQLTTANQQLTATLGTADVQVRTLTDAKARAEAEAEQLRRAVADEQKRAKRVIAAEKAKLESEMSIKRDQLVAQERQRIQERADREIALMRSESELRAQRSIDQARALEQELSRKDRVIAELRESLERALSLQARYDEAVGRFRQRPSLPDLPRAASPSARAAAAAAAAAADTLASFHSARAPVPSAAPAPAPASLSRRSSGGSEARSSARSGSRAGSPFRDARGGGGVVSAAGAAGHGPVSPESPDPQLPPRPHSPPVPYTLQSTPRAGGPGDDRGTGAGAPSSVEASSFMSPGGDSPALAALGSPPLSSDGRGTTPAAREAVVPMDRGSLVSPTEAVDMSTGAGTETGPGERAGAADGAARSEQSAAEERVQMLLAAMNEAEDPHFPDIIASGTAERVQSDIDLLRERMRQLSSRNLARLDELRRRSSSRG